jgi:hypothetical protein
MINWFKAPPDIVHKVKVVLGERMNKQDCLALCNRRILTDRLYEHQPENEHICKICLDLLNE